MVFNEMLFLVNMWIYWDYSAFNWRKHVEQMIYPAIIGICAQPHVLDGIRPFGCNYLGF